jgi:hypothetical protein
MRSRGVVKQKKRFLIVLIYIFFGWKTRKVVGHWLGREKTQWVPQRCFDPTTQTPRASALPTELQPALS